MKKLFVFVLVVANALAAWGAVGDTFTGSTTEGITIYCQITSETDMTCKVGVTYEEGDGFDNWRGRTAVLTSTEGTVTIPKKWSSGYTVTEINKSAFWNCSKITEIILPSSIKTIGNYAFEICSSLSSITIRSGVSSIGDGAFSDCSSLSSITIPATVETIGESAFLGCSSLTSITIPRYVSTIGEGVFAGCSGLTSIDVASENTVYSSQGDSYNGCNAIIKTAENLLIAGCKNTIIPKRVTGIAPNAFDGCTGLTSIYIPASVTSIGSAAFADCNNLTSVVSRSVYPCNINSSVFSGISDNCILTVPEGTKDIYIAKGWTTSVFKGGIVEDPNITFADSRVEEICVAHWDTNGDQKLSMAEAAAVTSIGALFSEDTDVTSFDEFQYFTGVTGIGVDTDGFNNCRYLRSITLPNSVTAIGDYAFYDCSNLTNLTLSSSLASIGYNAFYGCSSLSSIIVSAE